MNSGTPISSSEEVVFDHLKQYFDMAGENESLTQEDAVAYLVEQGIEHTDAQKHIEQLLLKGYLYEVHDKLRIPS